MRAWAAMGFAAAALAAEAAAEIKSRSASGFEVEHTVEVATPPAEAYARFLDIGTWWNGEHSLSGDAGNMAIVAQPGGCWCESLPDGGFVKHMDVSYAAPGKTVVFRGGLGPLLFMGAQAAMTVSFEAAGEGTKATMSFAAGGYDAKGFAALPEAVDGVLGEAMGRFKARADGAN